MKAASKTGITTLSQAHTYTGAEPVPVYVDLCWHVTDPLAVAVTFRPAQSPWVTWLVAVELLRDAVTLPYPVGDGDVRLQRLNARELWGELSSPDGCRLFEFAAADVTKLLERIDAIHPPWVQLDPAALDGWLEQVLAGTGRNHD